MERKRKNKGDRASADYGVAREVEVQNRGCHFHAERSFRNPILRNLFDQVFGTLNPDRVWSNATTKKSPVVIGASLCN